MAQRGIREYDAKFMWYSFLGGQYLGQLVELDAELTDIETALLAHEKSSGVTHWIVKPDQLFGKRGKYGLVGVKLSVQEVVARIKAHRERTMEIEGKHGLLHTFLIEPFISHSEEQYIACKTTNTGDEILFSKMGGVDIEEHRDDVLTYHIDPLVGLQFDDMCQKLEVKNRLVGEFIQHLYEFFVQHGGAYLEVNPFVIDDAGSVVCLDMVMKVDTCEQRKQKAHRKNLSRVKGFGEISHPFENIIEEADERTGASLKCTVLNPHGSIGLLLGGGGASVVTMDKLEQMGLLSSVINYGELSGNPGYDDNRMYVEGILDIMLHSSAEKKVLCMIGGIANFTKIDVLCRAFVDVLASYKDDLLTHHISIFVRRGGVNDTRGLQLVEDFCTQAGIPFAVGDGEVYVTEAMEKIPLFLK